MDKIGNFIELKQIFLPVEYGFQISVGYHLAYVMSFSVGLYIYSV